MFGSMNRRRNIFGKDLSDPKVKLRAADLKVKVRNSDKFKCKLHPQMLK